MAGTPRPVAGDAPAPGSALHHLLDLNRDGVLVVDRAGTVLAHNRAAAHLLGLHPDDLARRRFAPGHWTGRTTLDTRDGSGRRRHLSVATAALDWRGRPAQAVRLHDRPDPGLDGPGPFHDPLTLLPGRELFLNRVHEQIPTSTPARPLAVVRVDLDRFRRVNDFFGAAVADRVLQGVANRLSLAVRPGDYAARLEDDDFAVLLPPGDPDDQRAVADRILESLQRPFELAPHTVVADPTVALAPWQSGQDATTLLEAAEATVAQDRRDGSGSGRVRLAAPSAAPWGEGRQAAIGRSIARALDEHELVLDYEPRVGLATGTVTGFDAVVGWRHPAEGVLPAHELVRIARRSGAIGPLDDWVIDEVAGHGRRWRSTHPGAAVPAVGLSLSTRQLLRADLRGEALKTLARAGLDPSAIRIQVAERALPERPDRLRAALAQLAADGFGLELTGFGSGPSSLTLLQDLPVTSLALDAGLVGRIAVDPGRARLVRASIAAAHAFGIRVAAVGIGDAGPLELLRAWGCDDGRGPALGPALTPAGVARLLPDRRTGHRPGGQALLHRSGSVRR